MSALDDLSTGAGSLHRLMGVERLPGDGGGGGATGGADEGSPPRKRPRPAAPSAPSAPSAPQDDALALRRRVLEHKLLRLKHVRDRLTEQLSELYFLQTGGNMIEYSAWRKRPPAPPLQAFLEARRPQSPPAAEPAPSPAPAPAPHDEMVAAARQEAYVAGRVAELARAGLWAERRLPRVLEPPRAKTHWDYLLEEMAWLAQDFAHERKWKKQAAKKCARAVQKYFQDKAMAAQKAEKAQELQLRKIAAFAAKEIRSFWANVEKVVEWKRVRRVERLRKEALDEQLSYIVDRTERYTSQLAANLHAPPADTPPSDTDGDAHAARAQRDYSGDEDSADDETTIAEQERAEAPSAVRAELAALRADQDLTVDELLAKYSAPLPDAADADTDSDAGTDTDTGTLTDSDDDAASDASQGSLSQLVDEGGGGGGEGAGAGGDAAGRVEAAAQLAATLQPRGNTLAESAAGTQPPRLLRGSLREYQLVGLHWLATMHARQLNGILADEMGLGKTIQTIALLAHLALERADWGPHLVVAPTSVVLNWEMEFKKWCPAFKILTYYGTIKERKLKRVGWTKANSFHICITSYKLVVQDHQSFRRKRWKYLILDEAQNIKNFKSQRWQMLLNFQTERRLLLTGTPLQNSLLELWSLMHFLMPGVFASHSEFREWFTPLAGAAAEGGDGEADPALLRRLHAVLRPFLLRRLKQDVERQMPRKYEHVLLCRLAKRQRALYDDFMSRAHTRESLASGNLLSVINVLMQLRKVCNHPDLFEPRPVSSPLQLQGLRVCAPALALLPGVAARAALAARLGGALASLETQGAAAFPAHRARHLLPPRRAPPIIVPAVPPPPAPAEALRLHLRLVPRAPHPPAARRPAPPLVLPPSLTARDQPPPPPPPPPAAESASAARLRARRRAAARRAASVNERRCWRLPLYGADLRAAVHAAPPPPPAPLAPPDLCALLRLHRDTIEHFSVCWAAARAPAPQLHVGAGSGARAWRRAAQATADALDAPARQLLTLLHAPASRQAVAFPHPRLLQYDCGKLQTLDALLRRLKAGGHRVLIFTQMTRVLDVLEGFLSLHGHTYLRLDGATRVDRRQPLVDRFNQDPRLFAFILSTRSGGVGLNLTGADSVVFYDSDWNPTMDAQAQDRCHRIGQTRDVHVYRLVTAATVEENILRKAEQKRALGHLAIEDGHFTTSYLRADNIAELFDTSGAASGSGGDGAGGGGGGEGSLESALAAAEDEADAAAARAARAEQQGELAEFDETLPLEEESPALAPAPATATATAPAAAQPRHPPQDPDDADLAALVSQLTPVEQYAMRVVELDSADAEQAALDDMRRQLKDWERARRDLRAEPPATATETDEPLTYSGDEARTQVWLSDSTGARMPVWAPPTPPSGAGDVYCEPWAGALYRRGAAAERLLPAVPRAPRSPRRRPPRLDLPPLSLFERCAPRARARARAAPPAPAPDWAPHEDAALRRALRLQRLPPEPPPALLHNWDWCADLLLEVSRAYRGPRAARERHDALADPERARRRVKKPPRHARRRDDEPPPPPLPRLDTMREAAERRRQAPKRRYDEPPANGAKHQALLLELGVDYEAPPTPLEVASRRADRIAKEKHKAGTAAAPAPAPTAPAAPQARIVVAGAAPPAAAGKPDGAGVRPRGAREGAALLYRQQTMARQHLKILHHATQPQGVAGSSGEGGSAGGAAGALRTLQLQQLALRRAGAAGAGAGGTPPARLLTRAPHPHVVVAHLAPAHPPAPAPPPPQPPDRQ